ncbi:MAG: PIG-L family deacetylase [Actinobacteria bacterium]|nr:PIG-L family deacetylase [Actinomycetota bacterium]
MTSARLAPFPEDWTRALAVVAHPDDLEYGAASAIARWTSEGREIAYLLATRGEAGIDGMDPVETAKVRAEEERTSAARVGVDTVEFLDGHRDGVIEYGLPLRRDLAAAFRRHRPEVVVSVNHRDTWPGGWLNMADHRNVGQAILDAARDAGNRWVFTELLDDGLEPWSGVHRVALNASPEPMHAVDVTGFLDRGIASLAEHRAYLAGLGDGDTDPDAQLCGAAEAAGERFGVEHAVEFEVVQL